MDVILPIFSQRLKQLRRDRKITQKAMAELLGKTERHYQAIEAGCINHGAAFSVPPYWRAAVFLRGLTPLEFRGVTPFRLRRVRSASFPP